MPDLRITQGNQIAQMHEKPQLVIKSLGAGEPMAYRCSLCGQSFILPEDRTPKEGMSEVWGAFKEHVQELHPLLDDKARTRGDSES